MIHIIVTMIVKAGRMQEFLAECEKLRPLVLAEQGCIEYVYTRDTASPLGIQEPINANRITLVEKWSSLAALQVHTEQAHMKFSRRANCQFRRKHCLLPASKRPVANVRRQL